MYELDFYENSKNLILCAFLGPPDSLGLFFKKWASSLFLLYDYLTSYNKSEKSGRAISEILRCKHMNGK